ncbi:MAG TPA: hypothetical protein V6C71_18225 [Coleofasciculaceae cyanobacterium]|jgi:hypothetical protein
MHKQLFWLGTLVMAGILTVTTTISASAQTNQSDTTGANNTSSPSTTVNTGNRGSGSGAPRTLQYNSATGVVSGGGLSSPIDLGFENSFDSASGTDSGTGSDNQTTEVSLNEVAEALQKNLQQSLDNLAAVENEYKLADSGPRRIARRSSEPEARECINPVYEARQMAKRQLEETKKFIEQVNQIEPEQNLW